jgi:hypothetical protein
MVALQSRYSGVVRDEKVRGQRMVRTQLQRWLLCAEKILRVYRQVYSIFPYRWHTCNLQFIVYGYIGCYKVLDEVIARGAT